MSEKQLISKIKELRQIKPRENWVFLTKERIFNQEIPDKGQVPIQFSDLFNGVRFVLGHKLAFASLVIMVVLIGSLGFVRESLPGDSLYYVKKMAEKGNTILYKEETKRNLELANKRLDDLTKIAQTNSVRNLAPAINEYKATISEAAKNLIEESTDPAYSSRIGKMKEIALELKKLEENRQKVEALGVVIDDGTEELNNALAQLVEREIKELEKRGLTENEQNIIEEMKNDCESGEYSQALEKILYFGNINDNTENTE